jgi:nitrogen fixation NifU-like protein
MEDEIYKANILDHYKNPRHHGALPGCTVRLEGNNPSCGDAQTLYVTIDGAKITNASFEGEGCAISQASTSMLLEQVIGMDITEALTFNEGDMRALLGVPIGESREKCMMLGLSTFSSAITPYA